MTQDEIIEMARQAGLFTHKEVQPEIEEFAKLVDAKATTKERKACAKVCDDRAFRFASESPFFVEMHGLADAIRTRGEA